MKTIASAAVMMTIAAAMAGCAALPVPENATLVRQVTDTEQAFADTLARRDFTAFQEFLADEAIFYDGATPLRGKAAVAAFWKRYFDEEKPPFSWKPDRVDVPDSGMLAHSSGPVLDPQGNTIARFNSVWRQAAPGRWQIVFDKGEAVCDCLEKPGR